MKQWRLLILPLLVLPLLLCGAFFFLKQRERQNAAYVLAQYSQDRDFERLCREHLRFSQSSTGSKDEPRFFADWFLDDRPGVYYHCDMQDTKAVSMRVTASFSMTASKWVNLTVGQRRQLQAFLQQLPSNQPPVERRNILLITFYGAGRWNTRVYDHSHLPPEITQIYRIVDAEL